MRQVPSRPQLKRGPLGSTIVRRWLPLAIAVGVTAACESLFGSGPCDLIVDPAIVVEIRDAQTGTPLADSAWGVVIDGEFSDSLRAVIPVSPSLVERRAADEREGTYTVFVSRPGYRNWSVSGVRVGPGRTCSVRTARLSAMLVRLP